MSPLQRFLHALAAAHLLHQARSSDAALAELEALEDEIIARDRQGVAS